MGYVPAHACVLIAHLIRSPQAERFLARPWQLCIDSLCKTLSQRALAGPKKVYALARRAVPNCVRDALPYKVDDGLGDVGTQVNVQILKRLTGHQGIRTCFSRDSTPRVGQGLLLCSNFARMPELHTGSAA